MKLRSIIVDDEPPARALGRRFLERDPEVEVVAECPTAADAIRAIRDLGPDLVLLDVELGDASGFDVLAAVADEFAGAVIFATAYDRYAVTAFEQHAVDYLLKPLEPERVALAVERARGRIHASGTRAGDPRWPTVLESLQRTPAWNRLPVRDGERTLYLKPEEIERAEAEGNYVQLHHRGRTYLVRDSLRTLENRLGLRFLRISRSTLVNLEHIREQRPLFNGAALLVLDSGAQVTISRSHRAGVDAVLGGRGSADEGDHRR